MQRTAHGLVTVIPVYNGSGHLLHALESVARQTRRPDRLIVLNDQSTDATPEIARNFAPLPCEVITNPKNLGLFGNHNRALAFASEAEYLHILHADDLVLPRFYEKLVAAGDKVSGSALVYSSHAYVNEHGELPLTRPAPQGEGTAAGAPLSGQAHELSRKDFLISQAELKAIGIDSVLLKTCAAPPLCEFRLDLPQLGDCVFHATWAARCDKIVHVPEVLCHIRARPDNATRKNAQNVQSWSLDEWRAMEMISALIPDGPFARWLRQQKLQCLYAARTHVKIQQVATANPDFAAKLASSGRPLVGALHWLLGAFAVRLRDQFSRSKS